MPKTKCFAPDEKFEIKFEKIQIKAQESRQKYFTGKTKTQNSIEAKRGYTNWLEM